MNEKIDLIARGMRWADAQALIETAMAQAGIDAEGRAEIQPLGWNICHRTATAAHKAGFTLGMERMKEAMSAPNNLCRQDGRCQYAIDSGAEGLGHCPSGKCVMPDHAQGTTLGNGRPDWPDDLLTFGERKAYQRGIADERRMRRELAEEPFDPEDTSLLYDQLDAFMYWGQGASEDHRDMIAAFKSLGLSDTMVNDIMQRIVHKSCREPKPIDMVLHCPACGKQHIDAPEETEPATWTAERYGNWTNPPHRSHLCQGCGHIWRPADVPTNGVAAVKTKGKDDSPIDKDGRRAWLMPKDKQ